MKLSASRIAPTHPPRRWPRLAPAVLTLAVLAGGLGAQEEAPVSDFFETVEVNVVNIEVFVTDRKGQPVTGLTLDDFEILDEGEPVSIGYFYSAGEAASTTATTVTTEPAPDRGSLRADEMGQAPGTPQATATERPSTEPPVEEQLTVVLFVDSANIQEVNLKRVLEHLGESTWFQPGNRDQVMVARHTGTGAVEVVQPFTNDSELLRQSLDTLGSLPTGGHQGVLEFTGLARGVLEVTREIPTDGSGRLADAGRESEIAILADQLRNYAEARRAQIEFSTGALERFVDALAGVPGRKALVYVSDGLPLRPGEALFGLFEEAGVAGLGGVPGGTLAEYDTTPAFKALSEAANGHRVTFYTLLAGGKNLYSQPLVAVQRAVPSDQQRMRNWDERVDTIMQSNLRAPAEIIAEATGGRAFTEPKNFDDAIVEMRRDATHYYSLGYTLPFQEEGKEHKIKVRVKRDGLKVRHRDGYHEKSSQEQMAEHTLTALMFGEGDNPLGVLLELGDEQPRERGQVLVPLTVKLPISRLLLLPQETHHIAQVAIFVGTRDPDGRVSPVQQVPAPLRIPNDRLLTALGQVAAFQVALVMRPGEHTVVVGVRDELADVQAVARASHLAGSSQEQTATAGR